MASNCYILAHNNIFNKAVLKENAHYYATVEEVKLMLNSINDLAISYKDKFITNNLNEIRNEYSWEKLVDEHETYFKWLLEQKR